MKKISRISHVLLLLALGAGLASCGGQATPEPEPTVDVAVIQTNAVAEAMAQLTANAPQATATSAPTAEPTLAPTMPVLATALPALILPTATATRIVYSGGGVAAPTVNTYVDQGQLVYQNPIDGTVLKPGQDFDAIWRIKNIGRRDWNDSFYFRYIGGTPKGEYFDHDMLPAIAKGDEATVTVDMIAPLEPGVYTSQWGLVNDDAVTFFRFFITIRVQ